VNFYNRLIATLANYSSFLSPFGPEEKASMGIQDVIHTGQIHQEIVGFDLASDYDGPV
jgi:hypothetical protein